MPKCYRSEPLLVAVAAFLICVGLSPASIHSADEETVYRECEAFARGEAHIIPIDAERQGLPFGAPPGRGGRNYSLFGPGVSLLCVVTRQLPAPRVVGMSTLMPGVPKGATNLSRGPLPRDGREGARRRAAASMWSGGLCAAVVAWCVASMAGGGVWGLLAVLATPLVAYGGTLFSEPLQAAGLAVALLGWVRRKPALCGLGWGVACLAHVTGVLAVPLLLGWSRKDLARLVAAVAPFGLALGVWNAWRFGVPWETGRGVGPRVAHVAFGYGEWVPAGQGLYGLTLGPKGVVWFAPLALWGLWAGRHSREGQMVTALLVIRLAVVSARSDWHGGFSMGPRYLVPVLPLCMVGLAQAKRRVWPAATAAAVWGVALSLHASVLLWVVAEGQWAADGQPEPRQMPYLAAEYAPQPWRLRLPTTVWWLVPDPGAPTLEIKVLGGVCAEGEL